MRTLHAVARGFLFALAAAASLPAHAILPENGWYWNAAEAGRGFNIEIQDATLFMSAFVYHSDGSSAWYVASGPMSSDHQWSGDVYETSGGQCIGCSYRQANATRVGSASIAFTSERTASLTMLGTAIGLVRQDWSGYGVNAREALAGEWSTTEGEPSFPIYFGERIELSTLATASSGPYIAGNRTGSSSDLAVGAWFPANGEFSILLDSSTSYYTLYIFTMHTLNRIEGQSWTYLKSSSPTGSGLFFLGHRTKSGTRVRTGVGPGTSKRAIESPLDAALLEQGAARRAAMSSEPAPAHVLEIAGTLRGMMQQ
ncbi:MAG TPA: hypothetical protein VH301_06275 [Usitatibacter sp.]|nr:hypothetical protein [Usitatibacter sp.]